VALAQTGPPAASQPAAVISADQASLIDKMMGVVGPSEPSGLTERKRLHLYILSVAGPVPLLGEAAGAGIGQWEDNPKEWGEGRGAYVERFESNLAYNAVRQTITYGTSIAFHEDNRYYASHKHGFWARTGYAVLSTVMARRSDGREAFSVSSVAGIVGASTISSIWGPPSWKGVENISANAGISFAATAGFNLAREFLPDLLHRPRK
jgi:hypothetical protein